MVPALAERIDCFVGDSIERAMIAHHRRRLRRVGWEHALSAADASWAVGGEPPSGGSAIEVLVDGEEALPRMAEAIASARSHVHIAGWCVTPDFAMSAGERPVILRELLSDAARRVPVRVLVWGGAPLPLYPLSRRVVRGIRESLCKGNQIVCALDTHERPLHCHHEKLVIVDDELAFVGGIDLTDLAGNRLDRPGHPPRGSLGWHDVATASAGRPSPTVGRHFALRWKEVAGERLTPPGEPGRHRRRGAPDRAHRPGAHLQSAAAGGVLDSRELRRCPALCRAARLPRESISVVGGDRRDPQARSFATRRASASACCSSFPPSRTRGPTTPPASSACWQTRTTARAACSPARATPSATRPDRVYVHAKVGIVDDRWLTVGSANLNEHSLFNDTEMNVVSHSPALARETRLRLWAEHLARPLEELEGDPATLIDEVWRPLATEQLERRRGRRA